MTTANENSQSNVDRQVSKAVARLKAGILALLFGSIAGGGLFVMTLWLVLQSGPNTGKHLKLLGHYFIGYSVTWPGAFIGLIWGCLAGGVIGWIIGMIYNTVVGIRHR